MTDENLPCFLRGTRTIGSSDALVTLLTTVSTIVHTAAIVVGMAVDGMKSDERR